MFDLSFGWFRFGPRESKKAMMYSDIGRLNCSVSYTTFATPARGQVCRIFYCEHNVCCLPYLMIAVIFELPYIRDQSTKIFPQCFINLWRVQ